MKSDDTIVMGFKAGKIVVFKSFDSETERDAMMKLYTSAQESLEGAVIGHVTGWNLVSVHPTGDANEDTYSFNKEAFPV